MKYGFLLISIVFFTTITDFPVISSRLPESFVNVITERYFLFPGDGDGIYHLVDSQKEADEIFINQFFRNSNNYEFCLYTRGNPTAANILIAGNNESVFNSCFDFSKTTVVLVHGWNGNGRNEMNQMLTEAFLSNDDVNVIILDWSELAHKNYVTAKKGVPQMGQKLGQFLEWLTSLGASYERFHLVGFSLGGHIVGNAGRETGGRVRRITALDPAGPLWKNDVGRIVSTDAQYVEVIHTNTAAYGFGDTCGNADFYPNGGASMPGCWFNTCSHSRSYEYMAASLVYNHFAANQCETVKDVNKNICHGKTYNMGTSDLSKSRSGIFRVNTGKTFPF